MQLHHRFVFVALALMLCTAVAGAGQQQGSAPAAQSAEPDFRLVVLGHFDADTIAMFTTRARDYAALRSRMEMGIPPLVVTDNADEIERFERRLSERIREMRQSSRNQVFVPAMERQVKRLLRAKTTPGTMALLMDDSPPEFDVDVNDTYSKELSLATMPTNILLLLPDLPPEMEYRFVGRHLVLLDVRANMIIDEIPHALECDDCAGKFGKEEQELEEHR